MGKKRGVHEFGALELDGEKKLRIAYGEVKWPHRVHRAAYEYCYKKSRLNHTSRH